MDKTTLNLPSAQNDSTENTVLASTHSDANPVDAVISSEQVGNSTTDKTNDARKSSKHKQRGNQGVFQGEYKDYLLLRAPEYLALANRNERTPWLTGLLEVWFTKWPWHLGSEPEEFQVLNSPTASQSLTPNEIKALKERRKAVHDGVVKLGQEVGLFPLLVTI